MEEVISGSFSVCFEGRLKKGRQIFGEKCTPDKILATFYVTISRQNFRETDIMLGPMPGIGR